MASVVPSPVKAVAAVAPPPTPVATVPSSVCLELSSACQLDCPACPTARGDIARHLGARHLSIDDFRGLLDGHPQVGHIELSNWGELFLNKSLPDILRLAHERGVALSADNGTNLNTVREGILEQLVKYRLRSLTCSWTAPARRCIRAIGSMATSSASSAISAKSIANKERYGSELPRLRWQFVAFGHNQHEIAEAKRLAGELGMEFNLKLSWEDLYTEAFSPVSDRDLIRRESGLEWRPTGTSTSDAMGAATWPRLAGSCGTCPAFTPTAACLAVRSTIGATSAMSSRRSSKLPGQRKDDARARHGDRPGATPFGHTLLNLQGLSGDATDRLLA